MDVTKLNKDIRKKISECFGKLYVFFDRKCTHFRCDYTLVIKKPPIKSIWIIGEKKDIIDFKDALDGCGCECLTRGKNE